MRKKSQLLISIIVPVFNTEDFLSICLESLLSQTYGNIEFIIINDGSTDSSSTIIESYRQKDDRIKVINKKNAGVSAARNDGLSASSGEYILFVDSDDYLADDKAIELIAASINKDNSPDIIMFKHIGDRSDHRHLKDLASITSDAMKHMVLTESLNTLWNKVFKRDIIQKKKLAFHKDIRMGEDLLFNAEYFKGLNSLSFLNQELYHYREDNMLAATKKYMNNKYHDLMRVNDKMIRWAITVDESVLLAPVRYIRMKNVLSCMKDLHHMQCPMSPGEKRLCAIRYKQDNPGTIIRGCGAKIYIISVAYRLLTAGALYRLTKLLGMRNAK